MNRLAQWLAACLWLAGGLAPVVAVAADQTNDYSGRLSLVLADALVQRPERNPGPEGLRDLVLELSCVRGRWSPVYGHAFTFGKSLHRGRVASSRIEGDRFRLTVELEVRGDAWVSGGAAVLDLDITRQEAVVRGAYTGHYSRGADTGSRPVAGGVAGAWFNEPDDPAVLSIATRATHPALLVQTADLPDLRRKLDTPFGRALGDLMLKQGDAVCLGLMHQLTGDPALAERAARQTEAIMGETGGGWAAVGRVWGYRARTVALAYDLCRDAWDPVFRRRVERYLDWLAEKCLRRPWTLSNALNLTPGSNYMVVIWSGAGLAALARRDAPGPAPVAPSDSGLALRGIAPPPAFTPAEGVPVEDFTDDHMPENWLVAAPWPEEAAPAESDLLAALGGAVDAYRRIVPGLPVETAGQARSFMLAGTNAFYRDSSGRFTRNRALNLAVCHVPPGGQKADSYFKVGYYFTVLRVAEPVDVRFNAASNMEVLEGAWISGQAIGDGDLLRLEAGLHPLLLRYRSRELLGTPWGAMLVEPRLARMDEPAIRRELASRRFEHAVRRSIWHDDLAAWQAAAGMDPDRARLIQEAACLNRLNLQGGMGDGGFQAEGEGYTLECHRPLFEFALAYERVFGRPLSLRPDAGHFAIRYLVTTLFTGRDARGLPEVRNQTYGGGGGTLPPDYLGRTFPLCPPAWRPALLWFWNARLGIAPDHLQNPDELARRFGAYAADSSLAYAFLAYPLGMTAEPPGLRIPRFWAAEGKGFFAFRDGWNGPDDQVAQIYAKAGSGAGWNAAEAGSFQFCGLGQEWAAKALHDRGGSREFENVVLLPDDRIRAGARGRVLCRAGDPATGSGAVTIDLDPVYEAPEDAPAEAPARAGPAITGWRSFAVDYSGRSGARGVVAVADAIAGGGRKVWTMHVPGLDRAVAEATRDRFTIRKGNAVLRGVVLAPDDARLEMVAGESAGGEVGRVKAAADKTRRFVFRGVRVTSEAPEAYFLVVMTLQSDTEPPPAVAVQGTGEAAVVRVGALELGLRERLLRFSPAGP